MEPYVTLFCIFQVSCKCVITLSQFKRIKQVKKKIHEMYNIHRKERKNYHQQLNT